MHVVAKSGQLKIFEKVFVNTEIKSPVNSSGHTPLHLVCTYGHLNIAGMLMQDQNVLGFNDQWNDGTSLFLGCAYGYL